MENSKNNKSAVKIIGVKQTALDLAKHEKITPTSLSFYLYEAIINKFICTIAKELSDKYI